MPDTAANESFTPGPGQERALRDALGRFGTGVTVVTCATATGPLGITANSFASVSLDPPLVLWSPAKNSSRYPFYAAARHFAVHVMGAEQSAISQGFARSGDAFDGIDWSENAEGVPVIAGCLARFDCEKVAEHEGGDHLIVVARVLRAEARDGPPLLFYSGRYGGFAEG
ncbi:flavin reductase [Rhodosalinus halophilus]|uniref:Flavin reductase n=1 Tax=Rhodosalinus halophilus TaxID=2259333 RepID=A0A365U5U9_9RHOB|nr:flavin reductase family protein [Rhodosalinus halophilus]RBI83683.1 flavin reductase [Rhodosalinus halophilus]